MPGIDREATFAESLAKQRRETLDHLLALRAGADDHECEECAAHADALIEAYFPQRKFEG